MLYYAVAGIALLARGVVGTDLFVGCSTTGPGNQATSQTSASARLSAAACADACDSIGGLYPPQYSYFKFGAGNSPNTCSCSYVNPSDPASGNANSCGTSNYDVRYVDGYGSPNFYGCLSSATFTVRDSTFLTNPQACLDFCYTSTTNVNQRDSRYRPDTNQCDCGQLTGVGASTTCSASTNFYYSYSAPTSGTKSITRRQLRERALEQQKLWQLCPQGFSPCRIQGADGQAFECVDTQTELESCGGCVYGELNTADVNVTTGEDCTALNAALGAVTCASGQCQITACKRGMKLVNGLCA